MRLLPLLTYLFKQQSIVAEDSQWCPSVITRNIKLLSTADLHSKHMALCNNKHNECNNNYDVELCSSTPRIITGRL